LEVGQIDKENTCELSCLIINHLSVDCLDAGTESSERGPEADSQLQQSRVK